MGIRSLEAEILHELKKVAGSKLRKMDIMEWSTGPIKARDGETVVYLPIMRVNVAYKVKA